METSEQLSTKSGHKLSNHRHTCRRPKWSVSSVAPSPSITPDPTQNNFHRHRPLIPRKKTSQISLPGWTTAGLNKVREKLWVKHEEEDVVRNPGAREDREISVEQQHQSTRTNTQAMQ